MTDNGTWDRLCEMGRDAREHIDAGRWVIGDLALEVDKAYGENRIEEFAKEIQISTGRVMEYRTVCRFWQSSVRAELLELPSVTYSHLRVAMRLKDLDKAADFVRDCAADLLTVEAVRLRMNEALGKPTPARKLIDFVGVVRQVETQGDCAVFVIQAAPGVNLLKAMDVDGQTVRVKLYEEDAA